LERDNYRIRDELKYLEDQAAQQRKRSNSRGPV